MQPVGNTNGGWGRNAEKIQEKLKHLQQKAYVCGREEMEEKRIPISYLKTLQNGIFLYGLINAIA